MNYSLRDLTLANDLIRDMLAFLDAKGLIDEVDQKSIDYARSSFLALDKEFLEGPEVEDHTREGLIRKGVRFVTAAVYLDGTPVIGEGDIVSSGDIYSFAYWGEGTTQDDILSGKRQVVHSDLMVRRMNQIKPGSQLFEFRRGVPCRRILVESVDEETGLVFFIDLSDWSKGALEPSNYGVVPYKSTGLWNIANWFEFIDTSVTPPARYL